MQLERGLPVDADRQLVDRIVIGSLALPPAPWYMPHEESAPVPDMTAEFASKRVDRHGRHQVMPPQRANQASPRIRMPHALTLGRTPEVDCAWANNLPSAGRSGA